MCGAFTRNKTGQVSNSEVHLSQRAEKEGPVDLQTLDPSSQPNPKPPRKDMILSTGRDRRHAWSSSLCLAQVHGGLSQIAWSTRSFLI